MGIRASMALRLIASLVTNVSAIAVAFAAVSCASPPGKFPVGDPSCPLPTDEPYRPQAMSEAQRLISSGGTTLVGKKVLTVNGVTYPNDCTGLVRAAYAFASIDLAYRFGRYAGNGVRRIYATLGDERLLYAVIHPMPGDLLFWDNTYDANGNGRADDMLTHVGVVISAESDGSIRYLHYNYREGPVIDEMNLTMPDAVTDASGKSVNSVIRMRGSPKYPGSNAAQLFRVFGKGHELKTP
jgi:hypothetical protein